MIASYLQKALIEELQRILRNKKYKRLGEQEGEYDLVGINVFSQALPIKKHSEEQQDEEELFPYIVVRIMEGENPEASSPQKIEVHLYIGVCDEDSNNSGHEDILGIIESVRERFQKKPVLSGRYGCFTFDYPFSWALQEEDNTYPYYFGGISMKFNSSAYRMEDELT